ncbi:MAG: MATE family efflux transporter, partial [Clostridia bacterium]|nr:MATE family efflux transporter [Clostridia bacterium]
MMLQKLRFFLMRLFRIKNIDWEGEAPETGSLYSRALKIALPATIEGALLSIIGSIDSMMVGGIGPEALTAVGLTNQPRMILLILTQALCVGTTALIARRKGEGRRDVANQTMRTSILIIMALSIVMTVVGLTFSRPLMRLAGAKADTIDDAETYFRIITLVIPFNALSMAICAAQRGTGNTKITMYVNIVSNLVNVLLNWLLINGVWIFPRLEVKGAAIATAAGIAVGCLLALVSIFFSDRDHAFLHLSLRDDWRFNKPAAKAVVKVGGNSMLEQIALRIGFFLYARLVAQLGTQAYASHVVCMQFLNLSFTFADGIGVASTSLVGQMLGKERPDLSHIYGKIA